MAHRQYGDQTRGETLGREQEPIEAGERDTTRKRQTEREGSPPLSNPAVADAEQEDPLPADDDPERPG